MSMLKLFTEMLSTLRQNLTSLERRPINRVVMIVVVFLDVFVLISIFNGLEAHTKQLASPDDYLPHFCRDIALNGSWNSTNRTEKLANIVNAYTHSYVRLDEKRRALHPACIPFRDLIDQIKVDKALTQSFENWHKYSLELADLQRRVGAMKGGYDTSLLENISNKNEGQVDVSRIREDVHEKSNALNTLQGRVKATTVAISANSTVELLWQRIDAIQDADREAIRSELRTLNFWYPVKKLVMQLAFLLPLLGMLFAWNRASLKNSRDIQILISSHLTVVSFIPVFARIIDTVYEIIPKVLLKKVIELLEAVNLVAVWYYLVIGLAIVASLFVVYIFQKKLFSHEKMLERRLMKSQCVDCGKQLLPRAHFCPFCGASQVRVCGNCDQATAVYGKHCTACGSAPHANE